jgi:hypothetical protein
VSNLLRHRAPLCLAAAVVAALGLAACGMPETTTVVERSTGTSTYSTGTAPDSGTSGRGTVSGLVRDRTGRPAAGVIVEFKNLLGQNGHTTTDRSGRYSLVLPADVYTALAFDDDPTGSNYSPTSGSRAVSVPETSRVDFVEV